MYYSARLVSEAPAHIEETQPSASWPEEGVVSFNSLSLRYQEHLPLVLHSVSFTTKPQEKIGIVGRTGMVVRAFSIGVHSVSWLLCGGLFYLFLSRVVGG
jgi:hypothetical protein